MPWRIPLIAFMILFSTAATAEIRIVGTATGEVVYPLGGFDYAEFVLDWPVITCDMGADDTLVLRVEAPSGQAFLLDASGLDGLHLTTSMMVGDQSPGPFIEVNGQFEFENLEGPEPSVYPIIRLSCAATWSYIWAWARADYLSAPQARITFTAIEITYPIPDACHASFDEYPWEYSGMAVQGYFADEPGEWVSIGAPNTPNVGLAWGAIKAVYR